jgi:hypothetical protein
MVQGHIRETCECPPLKGENEIRGFCGLKKGDGLLGLNICRVVCNWFIMLILQVFAIFMFAALPSPLIPLQRGTLMH